MSRIKLSPGALYTLLNAEFKRRRIYGCKCQMPLPMYIDPPDPVSANWRIGTPHHCAKGCHLVITEIAAAHWPRYDLLEPSVKNVEPG